MPSRYPVEVRRQVVEGFVEALVVEPGDVLNDGELELGSAGPDAGAQQ